MDLKAAARTWPIICLVLFAFNPMVLAIKCYVCGPASGDAFPTTTTTTTESTNSALSSSSESNAKALHQMRPCEEFDASANKTGFERDCPENFHGCITQIEGSVVSRSCESLKIQSCGLLTDAAYCLCDSNLCNSGPISRPTPPPSELLKHEQYGDDEDYVQREGSGTGSDYIDSSLEGQTKRSSTPRSNLSTTSANEAENTQAETVELLADKGLPVADSPTISSAAHSIISVKVLSFVILLCCKLNF